MNFKPIAFLSIIIISCSHNQKPLVYSLTEVKKHENVQAEKEQTVFHGHISRYDNGDHVQTIIAKSGITLNECEYLNDHLKIGKGACDLLALDYKPFMIRAYKIAENIKNQDGKEASVSKIAQILKEFPETTDEWILDQFGYKKSEGK